MRVAPEKIVSALRMKRFVFAATVTCILLMSCKREAPTSWETDVLFPLANGRMTLNNIVADSLLYADENGLWHFRFVEELTNFDLDTLVEIPDTVITKSFIVPITGGPFTIPPGQVIINEQENNLISVNDVMLKEVRIKSGLLTYSVKSFIDGYLNCVYELPGVTNDGAPTVIQTTTLPGTDVAPFVHSGVIDLAGYRIDFTGENGFMFNRIFSSLIVSSAVDAAGPTLVSGNDSLLIELKFIDPIVSYARGYFGQHHYELNEIVDLSDNINFPDGTLKLESALMKLYIENNVGVDARINFEEVSNYNIANTSQVTLQNTALYDPINISRAYDLGGEILPVEYELTLNTASSNITSFLENLPDELHLAGTVDVNPLGDVTDGNDFIYTEKALIANLEVDIPLRVAANNLALSDTINIDPQDLELSADCKLELHVLNAFPFQCSVALRLIDGNGNRTLVDTGIVAAALPTENDDVTIPVQSVIQIPVDDALIESLNDGAQLALRFVLNTPEFDAVHGLYESFYMDYKLIANGNLTVRYD
jgi:hypothetical protein